VLQYREKRTIANRNKLAAIYTRYARLTRGMQVAISVFQVFEEYPRWRELLSLGKGTRHYFPQAIELVKGVGGRGSALHNALRAHSSTRADLCEFRDSLIDDGFYIAVGAVDDDYGKIA